MKTRQALFALTDSLRLPVSIPPSQTWDRLHARAKDQRQLELVSCGTQTQASKWAHINGRALFYGSGPLSRAHKWGYKIHCLSSEDYLLRFEVYSGAERRSEDGATFDTVMRMTRGYENKGHVLFVDNWFTSPAVLDALKPMKPFEEVVSGLEKVAPSPQSLTTGVFGTAVQYTAGIAALTAFIMTVQYVSTSVLSVGEGKAGADGVAGVAANLTAVNALYASLAAAYTAFNGSAYVGADGRNGLDGVRS